MHERSRDNTWSRWGLLALAAVALAVLGYVVAVRWTDSGSSTAHDLTAASDEITVPTFAPDLPLPEAARSLIERAVERCRRDQSAEAFAALGRIYHGNGLSVLASECYEIAIKLGADDAQTHYFLGLIFLEEGREGPAAERFRTAIEREPNYALTHHHLGQCLLQRGEIDQAIAAFARAVELDRSDPTLRTGIATALRAAGRLDDAERALREALALDPGHGPAHQLLGLVLHAQGRAEEAEEHLARLRQYSTAVYNDPWMWEVLRHAASVEVRLDWARNLVRFGRVDSAVTLLSDLAARHPEEPAVFRQLGHALLRADDHQRAVNAFVRAAELDPADAESRLAVAQILLAHEMFEEADAESRLALAIDPSMAEAHAVRGAAALRQGRRADAREALERALRLRPDFIQAAALLGEALIEDEMHEEAVEVIERVLPASTAAGAYAEYQLARALSRLGRIDEALSALQRAASIEPDNVQIQSKLAELWESRSP